MSEEYYYDTYFLETVLIDTIWGDVSINLIDYDPTQHTLSENNDPPITEEEVLARQEEIRLAELDTIGEVVELISDVQDEVDVNTAALDNFGEDVNGYLTYKGELPHISWDLTGW